MTNSLASLNSLSAADAEEQFLKCCGSHAWAEQMTAARPFNSFADLSDRAEQVWWSLNSADWLEAFRSHPKIGGKKAAAPTAVESQKWSADEQSGVRDSSRETLDDLARLNQTYEDNFGYIYIVCASGKSSDEMLAILRERLRNDPAEELRIAAAEQAKITKLRLEKLLAG